MSHCFRCSRAVNIHASKVDVKITHLPLLATCGHCRSVQDLDDLFCFPLWVIGLVKRSHARLSVRQLSSGFLTRVTGSFLAAVFLTESMLTSEGMQETVPSSHKRVVSITSTKRDDGYNLQLTLVSNFIISYSVLLFLLVTLRYL